MDGDGFDGGIVIVLGGGDGLGRARAVGAVEGSNDSIGVAPAAGGAGGALSRR